MKKIFGLTIAALMVIGLIGGGTWAYFSDPETTGANTLAAGTLDLDYDGGDEVGSAIFALTTKAPGDNGTASKILSYPATNVPGELDIAFSAITNTGLASGGGNEYGDDSGNLGANLEVAPYIDIAQNGSFDSGTDIALSTTSNVTSTAALQWGTLDNFGGKSWSNVYGGTVAGGAADNIVIEWKIAPTVGNSIQGDSVSFTMTFTLEQPEAD